MIGIWGANGFIGRHLASTLHDAGKRARLFARNWNDFPVPASPNLEFITADFENADPADQEISCCDTLVLLVSASIVGTYAHNPEEEKARNVTPYKRFLDKLASAGTSCRHVIFLSSGGTVYGRTPPHPVAETAVPQPISTYGQGKMEIERLIHNFSSKTVCKTSTLRVANPVGPWAKRSSLVHATMRAAIDGTTLAVRGDGNIVRDYISVREVAGCIAQIIENPPPSDLYNVGTGIGHTVNQVIDMARQITNRPIAVDYQDSVPYDVPYNVLDCQKILNETGWQARMSLEQSLHDLASSLSQ